MAERAPPESLRIEGRGPVAMALALFLARQGLHAPGVDIDPPPAAIPDWLAARCLALSLGSWQLLSRIVALPRAAPILRVEVSLRGRAGRTHIRAADLGAPALGYVLRYGVLHRALADALARMPGTDAPATDASAGDGVHDAARAGPVPGALTVVADGDPGAAARVHDFEQTALLAEVVAERDAQGTAFERFTAEGPLALLPLPEPHRHALVWCGRPAESGRRAALAPEAFARELLAHFGHALGTLRPEGERILAPLQRRVRARAGDPRRIAIGNAAQSLHPVAGQGLNLGLRDAFELARHLGALGASRRPLQHARVAFERTRRLDRGAIVTLTDALARVFTARGLGPFESIALGALDLVPPARNRFADTLMFGIRSP